MPKQINIDQTAKLYNIMGGNIPLAAVRQDIRGWEGFERRVLTRAAEMSVQDWQKDYRKKLADDYMARAQGYDSRKGFGPESRQDISGGPNAVDELRQTKMNREACATNIFYRAMHEGDWETAKYMTEEYAPLKKIYETTIMGRLEKMLKEGYARDVVNFGYQCVDLFAFEAALLDSDFTNTKLNKGSEAAERILKASKAFVELPYVKNHPESYIPSGTLLSHKSTDENGNIDLNKYGHAVIVLKDLGDKLLILEQAGELATSEKPFTGNNLQDFVWSSGSEAWQGDNRYYSYYESYSKSKNYKKNVLTMKPRIREISKSYLDVRDPVLAAPKDLKSRRAFEALGNIFGGR